MGKKLPKECNGCDQIEMELNDDGLETGREWCKDDMQKKNCWANKKISLITSEITTQDSLTGSE